MFAAAPRITRMTKNIRKVVASPDASVNTDHDTTTMARSRFRFVRSAR